MTIDPERGDPPEDEDAGGASSGAGEGLQAFEELVAKLAAPTYVFRLYVSGASSRSALAIANIRRICDQYLPGKYELEVIDVYQQPDETKSAQVIAIPTLVKELPLPRQRFIGDMSNTERIVIGLKLKS